MSITLNTSDFQCLQDQLVDLKTKNYEFAEKIRRSQADFEAAKAKICSLQLKLEEQERDFQVVSSTLRHEIESLSISNTSESTNDDYKAKYKKLLHKAKELQQRYEKSVEIVQQLNEKLRVTDEENVKLKEELESKQKKLESDKLEYQTKLTAALDELKCKDKEEEFKSNLETIKAERDTLKSENERLKEELHSSSCKLESQAEERKIQERKGLQLMKEMKRQLVLEQSRAETLQTRLENLLNEPPAASPPDPVASDSGEGEGDGDGSSNNNINNDSSVSSSGSSSTELIEEHAVLMERLVSLQHDKWKLEEKISYMEQFL